MKIRPLLFSCALYRSVLGLGVYNFLTSVAGIAVNQWSISYDAGRLSAIGTLVDLLIARHFIEQVYQAASGACDCR